VFLKGIGLSDLLSPVLALLGIGSVMLILSLALFSKWME
jgi:hypothetical protein